MFARYGICSATWGPPGIVALPMNGDVNLPYHAGAQRPRGLQACPPLWSIVDPSHQQPGKRGELLVVGAGCRKPESV